MKVFRFHKGQEKSGWFNSTPVTEEQLNQIASENNNPSNIATSIPSPFARMDLLKSAFKFVTEHDIFGSTNYHKLISDSLDIAQLFFNFDKVKNTYPQAKILAWDPKVELKELKENGETSALGKAISLFWEQDSEIYNFSQVKRLFVIIINHTVVGGTSPSTLFYSSPDADSSELNLKFGNVELFDEDFESLLERDNDFIRYYFSLMKQGEFSNTFKEVDEYLKKCLKIIRKKDADFWNELNQMDASHYQENYQPLEIGEGNPIELLRVPICQNKPSRDKIEVESDFAIHPSKTVEGKLPLILPATTFYEEWKYTLDIWDKSIVVNGKYPEDINQRTLPGQGDSYPFICIDDFLETNLIELDYELNNAAFHSCGMEKHLLPLKPLFFRFFTVNDLVNNQMLEVNEHISGGAVSVVLNVPTKGGTIKYKRTYFLDENISKRSFHCGLYPMLRNEVDPKAIQYQVGIIDDCHEYKDSIRLTFLAGEEKLSIGEAYTRKVKIPNTDEGSYRYSLEETFDCIQVNTPASLNGILIPQLVNVQKSSTSCKVAIDFGTTNTHIEYKYGNGLEKALDIQNLYASIAKYKSLSGEQELFERYLNTEVYPDKIGLGSTAYFPMRTALLENDKQTGHENSQAFIDTNLAFYYERLSTQNHHTIQTDLKWGDMKDEARSERVSLFIEQILVSIKNKLLADKISFNNLEVRWLYPTSMTKYQRKQLSKIWDAKTTNLFGEEVKVCKISESIAPYYFYAKEVGLTGLTASIDIGGGSSDISIFKDDIAQITSSVKFAGNAITGDGYNNGIRNNGFVRTFKDKFISEIEKYSNTEAKSILEEILQGDNPSSANFSSFLFSVDNNSFDYGQQISNEGRMKFVYLLFFGAQAYYLASLMKKMDLAIPENIIFSGAASKALTILDSSKTIEDIQELFQFIFNEKYAEENAKIKLKLAPNPKEISCKGALVIGEDRLMEVESRGWIGGQGDLDGLYGKKMNNPIDLPLLNEIQGNENYRGLIIEEVIGFYKVFDKYVRFNDLNETFGIDNDVMRIFKDIRTDSLGDFIEKGIVVRQTEADKKDAEISDSLFFYPLVGVLNVLANALSENKA